MSLKLTRLSFAALGALAIASGLTNTARAANFINPGFETGDFSGWSTLGDTNIQTDAFGTSPTLGTYQAVASSNGSLVSDAAIETALGLASGTLDSLTANPVTGGSVIYQTFTARAGNTLSFDFNFLTNETTPLGSYNDFAFVSLTTVDVLADTFSVFGPSATNFNEETGYVTFSTTVATGGNYTLGIGVLNARDTIIDSGIAIDNFSSVPEPATTAGLVIAGLAGTVVRLRRRQEQSEES